MKALKLAMMVGIACSACAAETTRAAGDAGNDEPVGQGGGAPEGSLGSRTREVRCVSEATVEQDEPWPSLWRATVSVRAGTARVVLGRSPQFRSHAGVWSSGGDTFVVDAIAIEGEAFLAIESDAYPPATFRLKRQGAFFVGDFARADAAASVTCWDTLEIFGSPWAQRPSVFPAHFDASLGACVDATGAAAHNGLPIAFVRETTFGECGDLSDAALNDGDFGYPDLALNLRGALLNGAMLQFANLSASLEGARMRKLVFDDAKITGGIDASTELPIGSSCSVVESAWAGNQVTCVR